MQIKVEGLTMQYGSFVVMRDLNFEITSGEIKVIMGVSGCGKSTLLKHLIGLERSNEGTIQYEGALFSPDAPDYAAIRRSFGVLFQSGALWSSMTLAENVALPLEQYTDLSATDIRELVDYKLSLVGLSGAGHRYPNELSGGMRKRAGLARAIALDPKVLFFDEPSAGLDPLSSRRLDDLILHLREVLGTTIVVVTHELASIFAIADKALYLDVETKRLLCDANPNALLESDDCAPVIRDFLTRGEESQHN